MRHEKTADLAAGARTQPAPTRRRIKLGKPVALLAVIGLLAGLALFLSQRDNAPDAEEVLAIHGIECGYGLLGSIPLPREAVLDAMENSPDEFGQVGEHRDQLEPLIQALPPGESVDLLLCGVGQQEHGWVLKADGLALAVAVPRSKVDVVAADLDDPVIEVVGL
ncbi:MAG: hypothetical protein WBF71_16365 [Microthrixaceae bacterium]